MIRKYYDIIVGGTGGGETSEAIKLLDRRAEESFSNSGRLSGSFSGLDRIPFVVRPAIVSLMEEYASLKTKPLEDKIKELENELDKLRLNPEINNSK